MKTTPHKPNNSEGRRERPVSSLLRSPESGAFFAVVVLSVVLTVLRQEFLSPTNLSFVARGFSFIAIAAMGMCFVIITGGIDLSIGSVMGLSGVIAAYLSANNYGPIIVIVLSLFVGAAVGLFNGLMISKVKLAPFIMTLGTLSIARGLTFVVTGGWPMQGVKPTILFLGQGSLVNIPMPVWIMVFLLLVTHFVLRNTTFGWHIYSIGGNEEASRLSGVPVDLVKTFAYVISGFLGAVAGLLLTARLGVGESTTALGYELNVIAAAVIGGVSLSGGIGSAFSALLGAGLMGVLQNGMVLVGVSSFYQQMVIGTVIIIAVTVDRIRVRTLERQ